MSLTTFAHITEGCIAWFGAVGLATLCVSFFRQLLFGFLNL